MTEPVDGHFGMTADTIVYDLKHPTPAEPPAPTPPHKQESDQWRPGINFKP